MDLAELIAGLSRPEAFPFPSNSVSVRQTHISVVFLVGDFVYKIKKPVDLGFLNFTTLERRKQDCDDEVRLNRRLAPSVYLGVVPITNTARGFKVDGLGQPIEWAVKMVRLPDDATLQSRLGRGEINADHIEAIARRLAQFHRDLPTVVESAEFGSYASVARNSRENFEQSIAHIDRTVSSQVYERLRFLTEQWLTHHESHVALRSRSGRIRDTHGDLHADHIYMFPDRAPPDDLVIIDCIEFNERFRFADPVADMAFLYMDLKFLGQRGFAERFAAAYFAESDDLGGRVLLPFYSAYRAVVRAKVEGLELFENEIPSDEKRRARDSAKRHWLLALNELETPKRRPCLILVGGLPGTGKSTLARGLAKIMEAELIRSDVVRKELAGIPTHQSASSDFGEGLYSSEWTDRTYAECFERAAALLFQGGRVIIDASFGDDAKRGSAMQLADRYCVPALMFICSADDDVIAIRLQNRIGDASDADWTVYEKAAHRWEPIASRITDRVTNLETRGAPEQTLHKALVILKLAELVD